MVPTGRARSVCWFRTGWVDCFGDSSFLGTARAMAGCLLRLGRCFAARVLGGCRSPRSLSCWDGIVCGRQPAVEAQDRVEAGEAGPVSRRDRWVGVCLCESAGRVRRRTKWRLKRPCPVSRRDLWVGVWLCLHSPIHTAPSRALASVVPSLERTGGLCARAGGGGVRPGPEVFPTTLVRPEEALGGGRNGVGAQDPGEPGCFVSIGGRPVRL